MLAWVGGLGFQLGVQSGFRLGVRLEARLGVQLGARLGLRLGVGVGLRLGFWVGGWIGGWFRGLGQGLGWGQGWGLGWGLASQLSFSRAALRRAYWPYLVFFVSRASFYLGQVRILLPPTRWCGREPHIRITGSREMTIVGRQPAQRAPNASKMLSEPRKTQ